MSGHNQSARCSKPSTLITMLQLQVIARHRACVDAPTCSCLLRCCCCCSLRTPSPLQELVVDAPQITTDAASPAVEPQVLNDQPFLPEDVPGLGRRGGPQATVQRSGKPPGGIPPGPPTNKPPIGGPNPDTPSDLPDFTDLPCIDTPDEFARAFVTGAVRCAFFSSEFDQG